MRRSTFTRLLRLGPALMLVLAVAGTTPARAAYAGRNGRILFTANLHGTYQLYTMEPDGTKVRPITNLHLPNGFQTIQADWSPDGTKMALGLPTGGPDHNGDLYVMNADGTGLTPIYANPNTGDEVPNWSPDGQDIVFAHFSVTGGSACCIYTIHADGTGLRQITNVDGFCPVYTPDGAHIVFDSSSQGLIAALWMINVDGTGLHRLTGAKIRAGCPDVSPDGQHIAFYNNQNGIDATSIFTMNIDGTGVTRLTNAGCCHHDVWAHYSPDGKRIVFTSDRNYWNDCCFDIFEINADGTGMRQITSNLTIDGCDSNGNCVNPDWGAKP
jgi:Tol biopolymer transport system component